MRRVERSPIPAFATDTPGASRREVETVGESGHGKAHGHADTYGVGGAAGTHGEFKMSDSMYPPLNREMREQRRSLAPHAEEAFAAFSSAALAGGAIEAKTKQLIAVAVAHVTQCPYCIRGHTKAALRAGATPQELMEAAWVAAEMRAGAACAHTAIMLEAIKEERSKE